MPPGRLRDRGVRPHLELTRPAQAAAQPGGTVPGQKTQGGAGPEVLIRHPAQETGAPAARAQRPQQLEPRVIQVRRQQEGTAPGRGGEAHQQVAEAVADKGQAMLSADPLHLSADRLATELKDVPLRDLCHLGGWKDPQTVLKCYQKPDEATMRSALAMRARYQGSGGLNRHRESTPRPIFQKV